MSTNNINKIFEYNDLNNSSNIKLKFHAYKAEASSLASEGKIFRCKKLKRNGLLEKKLIKKDSNIQTGRWTKDEHVKFMSACLAHGPMWKKVI
jgi:hypothetical protein